MSVSGANFNAWKGHLDSLPFLAGVRLNLAVEQDNKSFLKLRIKVKEKIVADGIDDPAFDASRTGTHLDARGFNDLMGRPQTLLVDMRNHFESEIGHFEGAILPEAETFRESLDVLEKGLAEYKEGNTLLMYCTGGIRCEKASAYFLHKGFNRVYQLQGGIIEYLRQVKAEGLENKFRGKNFVFDNRLAERISNHVVAACHLCGAPSDTHVNCANKACNILFIQCGSCAHKLERCCSETCRGIAALPHAQQRLRRKGYKAPEKYFNKKKGAFPKQSGPVGEIP